MSSNTLTGEKKAEILARVDHTVLKAVTTWADVEALCRDAVAHHTASVCIPPAFVKRAAKAFGAKLPICTVIGFPLGYASTETKVFETMNALQNGATEIDVVINLGDVKAGDFDAVLQELKTLRAVVKGKVLKVIIETCYLNDDEKAALCDVVTKSGADFIKTSTGFGTGGATLEDVKLMRQHIGPGVKIKASGGIRSPEDHEAFFDAGVDRIGSSSAISALG